MALKTKKISAIIEARTTSTRLPKKVLLPIYKDLNAIDLISNTLKKILKIDEIVLATTSNSEDDVLEKLAKKNNISCFRGSKKDVMGRVLNAAIETKTDIIVEITGDCPLIDKEIIDQLIEIYLANDFDYLSNNNIPSFPDGFDVRIFSTKILENSYKLAKTTSHFEHVTLHIREHPEIYKICNFIAPKSLRYPKIHITLAELDDYKLIREVAKKTIDKKYYLFDAYKIVKFLLENQKLLETNQHVKRKGDK